MRWSSTCIGENFIAKRQIYNTLLGSSFHPHRNNGKAGDEDDVPMSNPMARFDDGWETSYVADYQKDDRAEKGGEINGGGKVVREKPPTYDSGVGGVAPWDKIW